MIWQRGPSLTGLLVANQARGKGLCRHVADFPGRTFVSLNLPTETLSPESLTGRAEALRGSEGGKAESRKALLAALELQSRGSCESSEDSEGLPQVCRAYIEVELTVGVYGGARGPCVNQGREEEGRFQGQQQRNPQDQNDCAHSDIESKRMRCLCAATALVDPASIPQLLSSHASHGAPPPQRPSPTTVMRTRKALNGRLDEIRARAEQVCDFHP